MLFHHISINQQTEELPVWREVCTAPHHPTTNSSHQPKLPRRCTIISCCWQGMHCWAHFVQCLQVTRRRAAVTEGCMHAICRVNVKVHDSAGTSRCQVQVVHEPALERSTEVFLVSTGSARTAQLQCCLLGQQLGAYVLPGGCSKVFLCSSTTQ